MNLKKSISLVLTLCMVFSLFATFVFPVAAEEGSVTISFADIANRTEYTTEIQVWEQNGVTVTNNKANSTSDVGDYKAPARFYKNSSVTVEYAQMTKIVIDCSGCSDKNTDAWTGSCNDANATATRNGSEITIVFAEAVDTFTIALTANQARAQAMTIYYLEPAAPVTSKVVENWNHADWNTGVNGFNAAYIYTDAAVYAETDMWWWNHAAFAPTETEGMYEVTEIALSGSTAAQESSLTVPENGFVWVGWVDAAADSSGNYAFTTIGALAVGDLVTFHGIDIANCTTTEDAYAEKYVEPVDPNAPVSIALGKTYTYPTDGIYTHWDSQWECSKYVSTALTDGVKAAGYYGKGETSGWGGSSPNPVEIVIDLEKMYDIDSFAYTLIGGGLDGIAFPVDPVISVSKDNVDFAVVEGTIDPGKESTSECYDRTGTVTLDTPVTGRYVKFSFTKNGVFVFINELEVFGEEAEEDPAPSIDFAWVDEWKEVDENGVWQESKEVPADELFDYDYAIEKEGDNVNIGIKYRGSLSGAADSFGNGKGTNFRIWFFNPSSEKGWDTLMDVSYNGSEWVVECRSNGASPYEYPYGTAETPFTVTVVETADGAEVEVVLPISVLGYDSTYFKVLLSASNKEVSNYCLHCDNDKSAPTTTARWENSGVVIGEVPAPEYNEVVVDVKANAMLTDGVTGFTGNWNEGTDASNVLLIGNDKCTEMAMNVVVNYALGETKTIDALVLDFYHCAGVMIGYPEGKVLVEYSVDGVEYTAIGEYDLAAAELVIGSYGTVSSTLAFDAVDAAYVRATFVVGSSTGVLGENPTEGKVFWEFASLAEVAVNEVSNVVELPEDATGLDYFGYTHTYINHVMYVDADMTLGELVAKYYGTAKDLNYFKVIVVNADGTVAATYLTLGRPDGVKTDFTVTAGQYVLALSADGSNTGRFEIADTVNVGDIVTLYNVDFTAEPGELTNAGFTVEAAPAAKLETGVHNESGVLSQWGAGAGFDVLFNGYTGVGEIVGHENGRDQLFGISNSVVDATNYIIAINCEAITFDTITLYVLDYLNGGVTLPENVVATINGVEYNGVVTPNENGIATIVIALGEEVTAEYIEIYADMAASPYDWPIFHMYTEIAFTLTPASDLNEVNGGDLPALNPMFGQNVVIPANTALSYTVAFEDGAFFALYDENVKVLVNGVAVEGEANLVKGDVVTLINASAEDYVAYPRCVPVIKGTMSNPFIIDVLGDITANVTDAIVMDSGAAFYTYTATADGKVVFTMLTETNWTYTVNNLTAGVYGDTQWSDSDPVLKTWTVDVKAGDEVQISVAPYDPENPWSAPAGEIKFNLAFEEASVTGNVIVPDGWGAVDVLIDGYTGVGEITAHDGNHDKLVPFKNADTTVDTPYSFIVPLAESTSFNTVTVYALSHTNGHVALPKTLSVTINGKTYEAAAVTGDDASVVAIVVDLGETVEADKITVNATIAAGANKYTAYSEVEVSTVTAKAPDVVDLKVSHQNLYNWGTYESMIICAAGKTVNDVIEQKPEWWVMYVVEEIDGVYVATKYFKNSADVYSTACPENGFLYYVYSANSAYAVADEGKLLGYYFNLNDIVLGEKYAIDTSKEDGIPFIMTAVNPDALKVGDVNMNGKIDANDYATIRKLVVRSLNAEDVSAKALELADVNGNGKIDANDYILVKRHVLGTYTIPAWAEVE